MSDVIFHKIIGIEVIDDNRYTTATNTAGQAAVQVPPKYSASVKLKVENSYISVTDMPVENTSSMLALMAARRKFQQAYNFLDEQIKEIEHDAR